MSNFVVTVDKRMDFSTVVLAVRSRGIMVTRESRELGFFVVSARSADGVLAVHGVKTVEPEEP